VTNLSRDEVRERLGLRVVLEGIAFFEAAARMAESHFFELDRLAATISEAIEIKSPFELAQADLRFHRFVWEQCGNRTLCNLLGELTAPLFAFITILRRKGGKLVMPPVHPHETIVAALRSREEQRIKETVRLHIESSAYTQFLGSGADDFQQFAQKLA
jgi:DNA-binding GntR family transcriptional regulator